MKIKYIYITYYKNIIKMTIINLFIQRPGHPLWTLSIDDSKTILNLKEKIAAHYNSNYTGFNIINGDDVIDNDQNNSTLSQKSIKRIVRLAENYDPANIDRFQFKQKTNL